MSRKSPSVVSLFSASEDFCSLCCAARFLRSRQRKMSNRTPASARAARLGSTSGGVHQGKPTLARAPFKSLSHNHRTSGRSLHAYRGSANGLDASRRDHRLASGRRGIEQRLPLNGNLSQFERAAGRSQEEEGRLESQPRKCTGRHIAAKVSVVPLDHRHAGAGDLCHCE